MTKIRLAMLAVMVPILAACHPAPRRQLHLLALPDLSASIERRAEQDSLRALTHAVEMMRRGDSFSVIPIAGDTINDDEGRIVRCTFPAAREPFDGDLLRIQRREAADLIAMFEGNDGRYRSTDILGALDFAEQEFAADTPATIKVIVILSDFVQDDRQYHFTRDRRLRNENAAQRFAVSLSQESKDLAGVRVYLGELASRDLKNIREERRDAIRIFWTTLMAAKGAQIEWAADGPGGVSVFIASPER